MNHVAENGARSSLAGKAGQDTAQELESFRSENAQLRSLCVELEQALQEATSSQPAAIGGGFGDDRARDYEALLEEKSETIRELHQQLQEAQSIVAELEGQLASAPISRQAVPSGPAPREEEMLALSEELERERRQLQEDEQALMEQMREMEITMARERAEMARQRNDLLRVQSEVRHELERLERNGATQNKIDALKSKLQDANTRRGLSPAQAASNSAIVPPVSAAGQHPPVSRGGVLNRFFGGK